MIAGTATAVSNRVSRRQAGRWARQGSEEQYEAEPAPEPMEAKLEQLRQLADLKQQGILTDAEVETQKSRILES